MSHITSVKTKINNLQYLKAALHDLNLECIENAGGIAMTVKSWDHKDIVLNDAVLEVKTGTPYNIGVVFNEENKSYEFVADWWGIETYLQENEEQFMNKINQRYAYNSVMDKLKDKGYDFVQEDVDEKNNIRIVLRKWN